MKDFHITPAEEAAIQDHALRDYPHEACGALTPDGYVPLENHHPEPTKHFDCAKAVAMLQVAGRLRAVVHSHVDDNPGPSANDMRQQMATAVPWGICLTDGETAKRPWFWGDDIPPPPLLGRPFRHGPSGTDGKGDCYALIRDWYRLNFNVLLMDGGRDDEWWSAGENHYLKNFEQAGFVVSPDGARAPQIGDVMLMQLFTDVPAHAGVYVGGGLFLHHQPNRLSRREPTGPYLKHVVRWCRYERGSAR